MKLLFDFLPIILFFIVYKFGGDNYTFNGHTHDIGAIYAATIVMIIISVLQAIYSLLRYHKIEKMQIVTLVLVILLGGATLIFHDITFLKWKATAANWLFALGFLLSPLFTQSSLLQKMMGEHIQLPQHIWWRLHSAWIVFFIFSGALNLYVAFNFSQSTWITFKLFGMLGVTLIFIIAQSIYLARHAIETPDNEDK